MVCFFVCFSSLHVNEIIWYLSSLSDLFHLMPPRSVHVVTNGRISFFFVAESYSVVYTPCLLYPFIHRHILRFLLILAIVNSAVMDMQIQVSFQVAVCVPFRCF